MSKFRNKGLVAALEELEPSIPEGDEDALLESSSAVDETMSEVDEVTTDVSDEVAAIEEAVNDAETLGTIRDTMEESVETGEGMDETSAELAEVAVEAICAKLGFKPEYKPMPATENFSSTNTRVMQTKIAIEGISDTISKVWSSITAAVERMGSKISLFLANLTKNTKVVADHLNNLKAKVEGLDKSYAKASEELSSKAVAVAFSDNKEANFTTAMGIVNRTIGLVNAGRSLTKDLVSLSDQVSKAAANLEAGEKTIEETNAKLTSALNDKIGKLGKLSSSVMSSGQTSDDSGVGSSETMQVFGPFVKCGTLVVTATKEGTDVAFPVIYGDISKEIQATSAKALDPKEMSKLIDNALKLIQATNDFAQTQGDVKSIITNLKKTSDNIVKSVAKTEASETKATAKDIRSATKMYITMTNELVNSFPGYAITAGKLVGDYVTASIANWKPKAAEAESAPAEQTEA